MLEKRLKLLDEKQCILLTAILGSTYMVHKHRFHIPSS